MIARRWDRLPLRTRLALAAAGTLVVAMLLSSVLLYGLFARSGTRALDEQLERQRAQLELPAGPRGSLRPEAGRAPLRDRVQDALAGELPLRLARRELLAQVVGEDGQVLITSPPLAALGELPVPGQIGEGARSYDDEAGDVAVRVLAYEGGGDRTIQLAQPRDELDAQLARLRTLLGLITALTALVAGALGAWLARRALAPVDEIAGTAREIERTGDLARRVPGGDEEGDELARLGATLNEMLAALEASEAARRSFVADASHELRTPLTSLRGNLDYLAREDVPEAEREAAWVDVRGDVDRLAALAEDLLRLARLDARETAPAHAGGERVDMVALAGRLVVGAQRRVEDHELVLAPDDAVGAEVEGSERELERALANLLENAVRHTPAGTHVRITVARDGADVVVSVADDGPGVGDDELDHLFERFHRGRGAQQVDGAGLGLAIVRRVAELHGGTAEAVHAPGGGLLVRLRLPAATATPARGHGQNLGSAPSGENQARRWDER